MTVRGALLALLTIGPAYGHQLTAEFARRTGGAQAVNPGQTHATLERCRRDGLVAVQPPDADGLARFELTEAGRAAADAWLAGGAETSSAGRDDLALRVAIAASLPGVGAGEAVRAAREAVAARLAATSQGAGAAEAEPPAAALLRDRARQRLADDLAWLDRAAVLAGSIEPSPLADPPARGRRRAE